MKKFNYLKVYLALILILQVSNLVLMFSSTNKHYLKTEESVQQIDLPPNLAEIIPIEEYK